MHPSNPSGSSLDPETNQHYHLRNRLALALSKAGFKVKSPAQIHPGDPDLRFSLETGAAASRRFLEVDLLAKYGDKYYLIEVSVGSDLRDEVDKLNIKLSRVKARKMIACAGDYQGELNGIPILPADKLIQDPKLILELDP